MIDIAFDERRFSGRVANQAAKAERAGRPHGVLEKRLKATQPRGRAESASAPAREPDEDYQVIYKFQGQVF